MHTKYTPIKIKDDKQWPTVALFISAYLLIYLDAPLTIGALTVPAITTLLLFLILGKKATSLKRATIVLLAIITIQPIAFLTSGATPSFAKIASSLSQIFLVLCVSNQLIGVFRNSSRRAITTSANILVVVFFFAALLERAGITLSASEAFGSAIYKGTVGFEYYGSSDYAIARDTLISGARRPTMFSPEPSIAALGCSIAIVLWALVHKNNSRYILAIAMLAILLSIFKSPTIAASIVIIAIDAASQQKKKIYIILTPITIGASLFISILTSWERLSRLLTEPSSMTNTSEGIRITLPFINAINSLLDGNLFGAGIAANQDPGFIAKLNPAWTHLFGTNSLALTILYFGLFAVPIYYLTWKLWKPPSARNIKISAASIFLLTSFSVGAIESIRPLGFSALVIAATIAREAHTKKNKAK